jgi:hypothetical protein
MLNKKGIIFTLDAIFALIAAVTIITAAMFYMSQVSKLPYNMQALNRLAQDSLTVMEKDGTLRQAIETGSTSRMVIFLDSLPDQICAKIDLKSKNHVMLYNATKTGCTSSDEYVITRRVFIANNFNIYYSKAEFWYTGGSQ